MPDPEVEALPLSSTGGRPQPTWAAGAICAVTGTLFSMISTEVVLVHPAALVTVRK